MRKTTLLTWSLAAGCLTLTLAPTTLTAQQPNPQHAKGIFDLNFKGGTVGEYADAIRKVAPSVNIVVMPNAAIAPVPALKLQSVSVHGALNFLDGREYRIGREAIELDLSFWLDGPPDARESIFTIGARGGVEPTQSLVMSVSPLLDAMSQEDLLTAVEVALEMVTEHRTPATVKYHEATKVLLVRGHPEQIGIVNDMLKELHGSARRTKVEQEQKSRNAALNDELETRIAREQTLQVELSNLQRLVSDREARYALLEQEMQRLRDGLDRSENERRMYRDQVQSLQMEIAKLHEDKNSYTDNN